MRIDNNKIAMIIILLALFSLAGNLFVWLKITGNITIGKASFGHIGVCIDRPPTITEISNQIAITETNFTYQVSATDSGIQIYYYSIIRPSGQTFYNLSNFSLGRTTGLINFTPLSNETGNYSVYIWVTHDICGNNSNSSTTFVLRVELANRFPYWINYTRNFNLAEDLLFTANLTTFIVEPDNETINFTHNSTSPTFPSFDVSLTGLINFSANDSDVGLHKINITARDARNAANSSIFNFTVTNINDAPILQLIPAMQTCEDLNFIYQANASDDDLLVPLAYRNELLHYYDNTNLFVINEDTGLISFTPNYLQVGAYNIRVYVSDEEASDFKDFSLNIIKKNDAPVLQYIGAQTIYINSSFNYTAYASDEEDGNTPGTLRFNSTFTTGTKFFDINETTGNINFTANASINGTYPVRICVTDLGLSSPPANLSFCNDTAAPKNACENMDFTITFDNHAPNITSYYPLESNQTIYEGDSITFNATATDPEGTTPSIIWYKNKVLVLINDTYTFATSSGMAGKYNITVFASDGSLNSSVGWNVTVRAISVPVTPSGGGGGGGGGGCIEQWTCSDWSSCQNAYVSESRLILGNLYEITMSNCSLEGISLGNCGFQMRLCYDSKKCGSIKFKPVEMQICTFTLFPDCYDGILNCHDGLCEVLPDCGGPCKPCTTCSDGIQNQGEEWVDCGGPCKPCPLEYPKPAKCGDKKCDLSEIFSCKNDCGFFQLTLIITLILAAIVVIIARREIMSAKTKGMEKEMKERRKYLINLAARTQKAISEDNAILARHYYNQTKNFYNSLPAEEKKRQYNRIVKLFSDISKLK